MDVLSSMYEIRWLVYASARTEERANIILRSLEQILNMPITVYSMGPYWRDGSQYEIYFATPYFEGTRPEAVYRCLEIANVLGWEWAVTCPKEWENGLFEFTGITTKTKIPGVNWISFELRNYLPQDMEIVENEEMEEY